MRQLLLACIALYLLLALMARYCFPCQRSFPTQRAVQSHVAREHRNPIRDRPNTTKHYHPFLNGTDCALVDICEYSNDCIARPCDADGTFLPDGTPPPARNTQKDWTPWEDCPSFETSELIFEKMQASQGEIDELFLQLHARAILTDTEHGEMFDNFKSILDLIDSVPWGYGEWDSFTAEWPGPRDADSRPWKFKKWRCHLRDVRKVVETQLDTREFDGKFDYVPYEEFSATDQRMYKNHFSGKWANKQAVSVGLYAHIP